MWLYTQHKIYNRLLSNTLTTYSELPTEIQISGQRKLSQKTWARPLYRFYPLPAPIYISKIWGVEADCRQWSWQDTMITFKRIFHPLNIGRAIVSSQCQIIEGSERFPHREWGTCRKDRGASHFPIEHHLCCRLIRQPSGPILAVRNETQRDHRELKKVSGAGKGEYGSSILWKDTQSSIWACITLV